MRPDAAGATASDDDTEPGPDRRRSALTRMSERKFTRGLGKPGMAAQLRETVSQVVRESTVQVRQVDSVVCVLSTYPPDQNARRRVRSRVRRAELEPLC